VEGNDKEHAMDTTSNRADRPGVVDNYSPQASVSKLRNERPKILIKDSFVIERFRIAEKKMAVKGSSNADAWWNSTLSRPKNSEDVIWAAWMGEPNDEHRALVEAYGRKTVRGGYRGFTDPKSSELEAQSFEGIMKEYSLHANMQDGKSKEAKVGRPDPKESPKESLQWIDTLRVMTSKLASPYAADRVNNLIILADMSEYISEAEARALIERGLISCFILLELDATNESEPNGIFSFLRTSKTGSAEQAARYLDVVHISLGRIFRNVLCIFSSSTELQPKEGNSANGGIRYDWLNGETGTLSDIVIQHPGVYGLLLRLLEHDCWECKIHAAFALRHLCTHNDKNKQLILDTSPVLEILLASLEDRADEIQQVALVLLNDLLYCTASKAQLYGLRSRNGQAFISLVTFALNCGTEKTKETAAWMIWALSDDRIYENNLREKNQSLRKTKEKKKSDQGGKLKDAAEWLGNEFRQDVIKHQICRQPGLLDGLSKLLLDGTPSAQEAAAAAVWCLAIERGNKRKVGLQPGIVSGLSSIIRSADSSVDARRYASNAIRNLGTDPVALSYISGLERSIVDHLMKDCDLTTWQVACPLQYNFCWALCTIISIIIASAPNSNHFYRSCPWFPNQLFTSNPLEAHSQFRVIYVSCRYYWDIISSYRYTPVLTEGFP
jgi:hypothetical protein